jgi:acyl-CoA hydrolase
VPVVRPVERLLVLRFADDILPIDVALVQVSTPDKHGYCSLGVSVDIAAAAVKSAKTVIAQVNPKMPRTHGDGIVHISAFNAVVQGEQELPEVVCSDPTEIASRIASHCAELVDNGATLQVGIGAIPDAVLRSLTNHRQLGVHTEMFSDALIPLIHAGHAAQQPCHPDNGRDPLQSAAVRPDADAYRAEQRSG